jgi:hypothetical protein
VLRAGLALALAVTGSGLALVRTSGYVVPAAVKLEALSGWQWVVVSHVARRIAASDRPGDASIPSPDEVDVAGFVDAYVARMPAALRRDLLRAITYVEHVAPIGSGWFTRFTKLSAEAQDKVLSALETSNEDLLRGAFEGLKSLVFMGYYRDARTWKILGYEGPLMNRPPGGWSL